MFRQQQDLADEIRRSMHDRLVAELRLRQRNIVFPDTVRNEGVFYRNLASKSVHIFPSHRVFAIFMGVCLVMTAGSISISGTEIGIAEILLIVVGLKIAVNALLPDAPPKQESKVYPGVRI